MKYLHILIWRVALPTEKEDLVYCVLIDYNTRHDWQSIYWAIGTLVKGPGITERSEQTPVGGHAP